MCCDVTYLQYLAMDITIILSCDLMQVRNDYHLRHDDDDDDDKHCYPNKL